MIVTGKLVQSQGKGQSFEIQASEVHVIGLVDDPDTYPISPKQHSFEYLREVAHLRVRTNTFGAVTRVRHCLAMAVHRFFHEHGFYWIHTPIITTSARARSNPISQRSWLLKPLTSPPLEWPGSSKLTRPSREVTKFT